MARSPRERTGAWLQAAGAAGLFGSLFLTWSHQYPSMVLSRPSVSTALVGVPRDASAWQVYAVVDVLLALLAGALVVSVALGARWRPLLVLFAAVALAFAAHALAAPPTNGVDLVVPGSGRYLARAATAGPGEIVAIVALAVAIVGMLTAPP